MFHRRVCLDSLESNIYMPDQVDLGQCVVGCDEACQYCVLPRAMVVYCIVVHRQVQSSAVQCSVVYFILIILYVRLGVLWQSGALSLVQILQILCSDWLNLTTMLAQRSVP